MLSTPLRTDNRLVARDSTRIGINLYAYAGNDPVNVSDPFGLCKRPKELDGFPSVEVWSYDKDGNATQVKNSDGGTPIPNALKLFDG